MTGGTTGGIIGGMAGIGLAASGSAGRYLFFRNLRDFSGDIPVEDLLAAGVSRVTTLSGESVTTGTVRVRNFPKPAIRNRTPVLFAEEPDGIFHDVIRDRNWILTGQKEIPTEKDLSWNLFKRMCGVFETR